MGTGQIAFSQMENNDNVVAVGDQIVTSYISDKVSSRYFDRFGQ